LSPGLVTLVPGRLHRLGGINELDGRLHVYPPTWTGWAPSNCYLLESPGGALLVDTGFPANEKQLLAQLRCVVGARPLAVIALRAADYSSLGNGAAVVGANRVYRFYSSLLAHHLIGFPVAVPAPPEEADSSFVADGVDWARCDVGELLDVDPDDPGERTVEVVDAPLRKVGSARWLYDGHSRTLFTSDSFGHAVCAARDDVPVVRDPAAVPTSAAVGEQLLASFDWLPLANREPRDAIAAVFAERDVERVAPAHGCVLEGRDVVARHFAVVLEALHRFL
jgi:glyoxylase-like metal-dependent hydrolase (beta-lactamase superfamily II)